MSRQRSTRRPWVAALGALLPAVAFGSLLLCAVAGAGKGLLSFGAVPTWIVAVAAFVWVVSLQVFIAMFISRLKWATTALVTLISVWALSSVGRAVWWACQPNGTWSLSGLCASDPLLTACGVAPLVRALVAPRDTAWASALAASGQLGCIAGILWIALWRLISLPAPIGSRRSMAVLLTKPLFRVGARMMPGPAGGDVCIEWLRTLRGRSAYITLYAVASVILAALAAAYRGDHQELMAVLVIVAFAMVSDGAIEMLKARSGNQLYQTYGADHRHYMLGFMTSLGVLVAALCIVQIPIYCTAGVNWRLTMLVASVCLATGIAVVPIAVSVDAFIRRLRGWHVGRVISMAKAGFVVLLVPTLLFLLGSFHFAIPLVLAGMFVYVEVRRADRTATDRLYWRL